MLQTTMTGDIFIIPNSARKVSEFYDADTRKKDMEELCEANGTKFDENDFLVETWICSEDASCKTDNFSDHGAFVEIDNTKFWVDNCYTPKFIPLALLPSKEGETVEIKIPSKCCYADKAKSVIYRDHKNDIMITAKLTAAQTKYRYRRFGNFEQVLGTVCR